MKLPDDIRHSRERLDLIHPLVEFFFATLRYFRQAGSRDPQELHDLARPHVAGSGHVGLLEAAEPELRSHEVEDLQPALEGVRHGAVEIEKQKLRSRGQAAGSPGPAPASAHHKSRKPFDAGASFGRTVALWSFPFSGLGCSHQARIYTRSPPPTSISCRAGDRNPCSRNSRADGR